MSLAFGGYQLDAVECGEFRLDGGAMFGVVPKVIWEKGTPADDKNRIRMNVRSLLIRGSGRTILVDTGLGDKWTPKQTEMFAIDHSRYDVDRSLAKLGLKREDITDVVLSHLHFDHVGGATRRSMTGVELSFPNATYYVQRKNLSHAHAPNEKDRASFIEETITPLIQSQNIKVIDGDFDLMPGVRVWVTHGHTPGHQMVKVSDGKRALVICGDTIPTSAHIPLPWVMAYDLYPLTTMEEKRGILTEAVRDNWILFFTHDASLAACTVVERDGRYSRGTTVSI